MKDTERLVMKLIDETNSKLAKDEYEDSGNGWTDWHIKVYKIYLDEQCVYFQIAKEISKTKENVITDGKIIVKEVEPKEITIIEYFEIDD